MKIIDERQTAQIRFDCVPYGAVFLDETGEPVMEIAIDGIDYIVVLSSGDVYLAEDLFSPETIVTVVEATLTIK